MFDDKSRRLVQHLDKSTAIVPIYRHQQVEGSLTFDHASEFPAPDKFEKESDEGKNELYEGIISSLARLIPAATQISRESWIGISI